MAEAKRPKATVLKRPVIFGGQVVPAGEKVPDDATKEQLERLKRIGAV